MFNGLYMDAAVNRTILLFLLGGMVLFQISLRLPALSNLLGPLMSILAHPPNALVFVMAPVLVVLALTMAVLWKIKEVILNSVFGGQR